MRRSRRIRMSIQPHCSSCCGGHACACPRQLAQIAVPAPAACRCFKADTFVSLWLRMHATAVGTCIWASHPPVAAAPQCAGVACALASRMRRAIETEMGSTFTTLPNKYNNKAACTGTQLQRSGCLLQLELVAS